MGVPQFTRSPAGTHPREDSRVAAAVSIRTDKAAAGVGAQVLV